MKAMFLNQLKRCRFDRLYVRGIELGKGNYGTTYLCTKITTGRKYACKCISKRDLTLFNENRELVEREIDILKFIGLRNHPNIISVKDVFDDDQNVYIIMELCEGGSIFDRFNDRQAVCSELKAAQLTKQIVGAIQACHSVGIVHRDIKPGNVVFKTRDEDSIIKVIDFGLSTYFDNYVALTDVVGTPSYVAPEVMEGRHGPKVDIWSTGVVLYKLLSGFLPFRGKTLKETYEVIMEGNGPCFEKYPWPTISYGAKDLIQGMLKHNVNERLSAWEVLRHPWILRHHFQLIE